MIQNREKLHILTFENTIKEVISMLGCTQRVYDDPKGLGQMMNYMP